MMLRHGLWADLQSARCHSNIYSAPVKHLGTTGVKIPALNPFCMGEEDKKAPSESKLLLFLPLEKVREEVSASGSTGGFNRDLHR